jgi:hypothetical protein
MHDRHRRSQTHRAPSPGLRRRTRAFRRAGLARLPPGSGGDHLARQELVRQIECRLVVNGFRASAGAGLHQGVDEISGLVTRHLGADRSHGAFVKRLVEHVVHIP